MPEWWTYTLSDFLLFSPRTYYRLIERHNQAVWPAQPFAVAAGIVVALLVRRRSPDATRWAAAILAVLWAWVGWGFVVQRYATINWAAAWLAWLFAAETILLVWLGAVAGKLRAGARRDAASALGAVIVTAAVVLYPLLAPPLGRGWPQSEVFGIAPDPTALGTLGVLLLVDGSRRSRHALLAPPLLWCLVSGATLLAMGSSEAWLLLAAVPLVVAVSAARGGSIPASRRTREE